jgi:hypothetical protein
MGELPDNVFSGSKPAVRAILFLSLLTPLTTEVKIGNVGFVTLTSAYPPGTVVNQRVT